jgi:hypothetical protein
MIDSYIPKKFYYLVNDNYILEENEFPEENR